MKIQLLDGSIKEFEQPLSVLEIAKSLSISLSKKCVAGKVNGELKDLSFVVENDSQLELILEKAPESYDILNHSCAHLLAQAVKNLYPNALLNIGPSIEEGFYYDIDFVDTVLKPEDLEKIEKEMKKLSNQQIKIVRSEISKAEALELFKNNPYKVDTINELSDDETISMYTQGDFYDLCRGPHVENTSKIKAFKLLSLAGAYYKGDSNNKQLTRIYGTAFFSDADLKEHLNNLEERKKRDHRKIGKELDLFMISEYGPGFPFWLFNGMKLRRQLENYWYDVHTKDGYKLVQTPIMLNKELWEVSGHWFNYRDNMFTSEIDKHEFAIKPMNCPGGMLVYKNSLHSYKDFPLKVAELGLVHRYEASGALSGLFRVRNFTQDDAHIFMREDQIVEEVGNLIDLYEKVYSKFNLDYHIELSTRPEDKYIGSIEIWDKAEKALEEAVKSKGKKFILNPGDGAFYGPKLDFKLRDSMNRIWQCGTIQLDMNLPERFDLTYVDENGEKKRPIMLHRALFGSIERFIGILTEHYAGSFPTWLSPTQVKIIPVNLDLHKDYCDKIYGFLNDNLVNVETDYREEKLGYKIREAQTKKWCYSLVIGDKEVEGNLVTYRKHGSQEQITVTLEEFYDKILKEIKERL